MNQFLSDVSRLLASSDNASLALQRVARAAVPTVADFCFIFLLKRTQLKCAACAHVSREGDTILRGLNRVYRISVDDAGSTVAQAVRTGRPQLRVGIVSEAETARDPLAVFALHRRLRCRSALAVPIGSPPDVFGALSLCYSTSGRKYTPQDIRPARRLATLLEAFLQRRAAARRQSATGRRAIRLRARS